MRIVYEIFFSNAPKTLSFARDFLMAGIAEISFLTYSAFMVDPLLELRNMTKRASKRLFYLYL